MTWDDAVAFARSLSERVGGRWRLPTEAEWELAAGGGLAGPRTAWGEAVPPGEIPEGPLSGPWEAGRGTPNGFGLCDMGTIVHEWCEQLGRARPTRRSRPPREPRRLLAPRDPLVVARRPQSSLPPDLPLLGLRLSRAAGNRRLESPHETTATRRMKSRNTGRPESWPPWRRGPGSAAGSRDDSPTRCCSSAMPPERRRRRPGPTASSDSPSSSTTAAAGRSSTTRMVLGADGAPTLVETQGNDYLKSPVTERFAVEKGAASWKNPSEKGERKLAGSAYYLSLNGVPQETGLLARALLRAPGRRLALLPDGEASIERVAEATVRAGSGERTVTLYAISGLDFTPEFVWLDRDGTYFASASTWLTTVREGWESAVPKLLEAQEAAESVQAKALAKAASRRPGTAAGLSGREPLRRRDRDEPQGNDRRRVGRTHRRRRARRRGAGAGGRRGDRRGRPDAAARARGTCTCTSRDLDGPLNIASGVTSVRDLANDIDKLAALSRSWDEGTAVGPRVIAAGFIDGPGPYAGPTKVLVDTPEEARAAVARYASLGYPQIKVYSSMRPELVPVIIAAAHERGMRVSGHVPAFMTADQFVRLGADEIQHANFLFLNFWGDTVKDTRTPLRFTAVAQNAAELDLDSERVRAFLSLLKEHGTVSDPTVAIFEEMFVGRPGTVSPGYAAIADRLPVQVRRGLLTGGLPVPEGSDQRYRDSFRAILGMVRRLESEGIPIVAGTDSLAGFTLDRELELYVEAGIPAPRVLQIATLGRRARDEERRGAGLDRARQEGRPRPRRRGPVRAHLRRPARRDRRQERSRLRPGGDLPGPRHPADGRCPIAGNGGGKGTGAPGGMLESLRFPRRTTLANPCQPSPVFRRESKVCHGRRLCEPGNAATAAEPTGPKSPPTGPRTASFARKPRASSRAAFAAARPRRSSPSRRRRNRANAGVSARSGG